MRKTVQVMSLGFLVLMFMVSSVNADLILNPSDDTWTDVGDSSNTKDGSGLFVSYDNLSGFKKTTKAYLRFDLSGIYKDLGPTTALRLYVTSDAFLTTGTLNLCSTGDDWNGALDGNGNEGTLTEANAPSPTCISVLDTKPALATGNWVEFSGAALSAFVNSQRVANSGDGMASFTVEWAGCTECSFNDTLTFEDLELTQGTANKPQLYPLGPNVITLSTFRAADPTPNWPLIAGLAFLAAAILGGGLILARRRALARRIDT
jgi:hypothetical protein